MREPEQYVVCLSNEGFPTSLVVRRIYPVVPDAAATDRGLVRVVDESGQDYLFPCDLFEIIELPAEIRRRLAAAT